MLKTAQDTNKTYFESFQWNFTLMNTIFSILIKSPFFKDKSMQVQGLRNQLQPSHKLQQTDKKHKKLQKNRDKLQKLQPLQKK
jgi:hypothetical protein